MTVSEEFDPEFGRHDREEDDWCSICKHGSERFVDVRKPSRPSKGEGQADILEAREDEDTHVPGDYVRLCCSCVARMVKALEESERK